MWSFTRTTSSYAQKFAPIHTRCRKIIINRIVEWSHTWQLVPVTNLIQQMLYSRIHHLPDVAYSVENCLIYCTRVRIDLVVTMNNGVKFSKHIAKVAVKGYRTANLILKCFLSRDINSLVRAFTSHNIKIVFAHACTGILFRCLESSA